MMTDDKSWHVKKEINLGHLLTTATAIVSFFIWIQTIETRLAVLESNKIIFKETVQEIKSTLIRIETKLDHKADKPHF